MKGARVGGILVGLGMLLIVVTIVTWSLFRGFSNGVLHPGFTGGLPMYFVRIGIALTVIGVATLSLRPISTERAVIVAIVALAVVFLVSAVVRHHEFIMTTPEAVSRRTVVSMATYHASETLVLALIPAGFVAGVIEKRGRPATAFRTLVGTMVAAWFVTVLLKMATGPISSFTVGFALVGALGATYIAIVPRNLIRRVSEIPPR